MIIFFSLLVIACCIALASLLTALLAWRGRENNLTYTLVFLVLCYVFIMNAAQFLLSNGTQPDTWRQWQEIYNTAKDNKGSKPENCNGETTSPVEPDNRIALPVVVDPA